MYSASDFEDLLSCCYCKTRFTDSVKLIPECGNSICQPCHEGLKDKLNGPSGSRQYVCAECGDEHELPADGLGDNKALLKMLVLPVAVMPPNPKEKLLNSKVRELQIKILQLKDFDVEEQVGIYCEELNRQVLLAIDDAFNHLNRLGNKMLSQISDYQASFAEAKANKSRPAKRIKTEETAVHQDLDRFLAELKQLQQRGSSGGEPHDNDGDIDSTLDQIEELQAQIDQIQAKLRDEILKDNLMVFEPKSHLTRAEDLLGKLVIGRRDRQVKQPPAVAIAKKEKPATPAKVVAKPAAILAKVEKPVTIASVEQSAALAKIEQPNVEQPVSVVVKSEPVIPPTLPPHVVLQPTNAFDQAAAQQCCSSGNVLLKLTRHTGTVLQVTFLADGNLASCSEDKTIKIWDTVTGHMLYELRGSLGRMMSLATLPNNYLVSGCVDSALYLWDLEKRKLADRRHIHLHPIFSIKVFPDGTFASASFDGLIKIWKVTDTAKMIVLNEVAGHGIRFNSDIGILPSNELIACSNSQSPKEGSHIKIWTTTQPNASRLILNSTKESCALQVLANQKVAIAFYSGKIRIYNMRLRNSCIEVQAYKPQGRICLAESPTNGNLFSGGPGCEPFIKIWNPETGALVRSIRSSHVYGVISMGFSKNGKMLATAGSGDHAIYIISF